MEQLYCICWNNCNKIIRNMVDFVSWVSKNIIDTFVKFRLSNQAEKHERKGSPSFIDDSSILTQKTYRIGANWAPVLIRPPPHENPNRTPVKKRYWNNWTPSWIDPHPRYQYIRDFTRNGKNLTIFRRNHDVLFIQKLDKLKLLSHKEHWRSFPLMNSLYMFFMLNPLGNVVGQWVHVNMTRFVTCYNGEFTFTLEYM